MIGTQLLIHHLIHLIPKEKSENISATDYDQLNKLLRHNRHPDALMVLRLIVLGYSNQEIAQELSYSYNYVKKVVAVIYEKKCVNKRTDLKNLVK